MKERIEELDVIRGYAIFGILICNIVLFNYPIEYLSQYFSDNLAWLDQGAAYLRFNFFGDKTFSVFSLLFGIGIGMQCRNARDGFTTYHLVRMILLLIIGLVHALLIWYGDILALYAVLGLLVLTMIRLPIRVLVAISIVIFLWPTFQTVLMRNGVLQFNFAGHDLHPLKELIAMNTRQGLIGHLKYNVWQILPTVQFYLSGTLYHSLSMIILGVALGRKGVIYHFDQQISIYRKLLFSTGTIVVIWNLYQLFFFDRKEMGDPTQFYVYWGFFNISLLGQTFFVVAALMLLMRTGWGYKLVGAFRYLGRMSLTNYLLHSLLGLLIFKVLGFYGQSSPSIDLLLAVLLTVFQIALSRLWLNKYGSGPVEKLWKRLSAQVAKLIR